MGRGAPGWLSGAGLGAPGCTSALGRGAPGWAGGGGLAPSGTLMTPARDGKFYRDTAWLMFKSRSTTLDKITVQYFSNATYGKLDMCSL